MGNFNLILYLYLQKDIAYSQIEEAWAEFLAQNYARRIYDPAYSGAASREWYDKNSEDLSLKTFNWLKEDEHYFVSSWIPKGAFNDFMDSYNSQENWDNISGFTIKQLWDVLSPTVISDYHYRKKMAQMYPWVSEANVKEIFYNNRPQ